jgi:hypothetical protein
MPRKSRAAVGAELWRRNPSRKPAAPARLNPEARQVWRRIVADRPDGWFRPGSLELLEDYCFFVVEGRRVIEALAKVEPTDSRSYARLLRMLALITSTEIALSTKLRLAVQHDVMRRSARLAEKGTVHDPLLGGFAVANVVPMKPRKRPEEPA